MKKIIILFLVFFVMYALTRTIGLLVSFGYPDRQFEIARQNQNVVEIDKWRKISIFTHSNGYVTTWTIIGLLSGLYASYRISKRLKK